MVFRITFLLAVCIVSNSVAQGPIIEVPADVTVDNLYCWLYGMGIRNLNSTDCNRTCGLNAPPRVCIYNFVLEQYHAMGSACGNCSQGVLADCMHPQCITGDGTERGVMAINRGKIGPDIQVCLRDVVIVNVDNRMGGTESTIHWHGILQEGTQWMDGVPKVTQCGIPEASKFRYVFPVTHPGTYFYHSHSGLHNTNGHNGALIVRQPRNFEPARNLYSQDRPGHVIVLKDYMHDDAEMFFPGLRTRAPGIGPVSFLMNGLGRWRNPATNQTTQSPLATFHIQPGVSYRFRLINAATLVCPMQFQIQNHNLTVISTDGSDVMPQVVDAIVSSSGERFDFILNANQTTGAFWIHLSGLGVCADIDRIDQVGVLSYGTSEGLVGIYPTTPEPTMNNLLPFNTRLNHPKAPCTLTNSEICVSQLRGYVNDFSLFQDTNIARVDLNFGYWEWNVTGLHGTAANPDREYNPFQLRPTMLLESGVINGITNEFPDTVSMLNRNSVRNSCNQRNKPSKCAPGGFCRCVHIITLPWRTNIEMVVRDVNQVAPGDPEVFHPMHWHGYKVYAMEIVGRNETLQMNNSQSPNRIPPLKDTLVIPQGGAARIRLFTGNPGDWLFHCHFEWHMAIGMSAMFRVQGPIPSPPPNFPTCGSFDPITMDSCPQRGFLG